MVYTTYNTTRRIDTKPTDCSDTPTHDGRRDTDGVSGVVPWV